MIGSFIGAASHIIKIVSIVMHKTIDGTKQFVRFLRERGIKYIYAKETLRYAYRKEYEWKEPSAFISNDVDGNLLKYFDKLFLRDPYTVISRSFLWDSTENGYEFWMVTEEEWEWNYRHKLLTDNVQDY